MKCHLERDWLTARVKVWVYTDGPGGGHILSPDLETMRPHDPATELPEPSLVLHEEVLRALVREGAEIVPATDATTAHLNDAIRVRDRLLSLLEERYT